jgi:hypothetical protein
VSEFAGVSSRSTFYHFILLQGTGEVVRAVWTRHPVSFSCLQSVFYNHVSFHCFIFCLLSLFSNHVSLQFHIPVKRFSLCMFHIFVVCYCFLIMFFISVLFHSPFLLFLFPNPVYHICCKLHCFFLLYLFPYHASHCCFIFLSTDCVFPLILFSLLFTVHCFFFLIVLLIPW